MKPSFALLLSALIATSTALPIVLQRNAPTALVRREEESPEDADDVNIFSSYKPNAERREEEDADDVNIFSSYKPKAERREEEDADDVNIFSSYKPNVERREEEDADDVNIFSSYGKKAEKREEEAVDPDDINIGSSYGKKSSKREEDVVDPDDINIGSSYGKKSSKREKEAVDPDDINIGSSYGKKSSKREEDVVDPDDINIGSSYGKKSSKREEDTVDPDDINIGSSYGKKSSKREEDIVDPDDINIGSSYGKPVVAKREEETVDPDDVNIGSSYGKQSAAKRDGGYREARGLKVVHRGCLWETNYKGTDLVARRGDHLSDFIESLHPPSCCSIMAPKPNEMKQKSLMSFFGKPAGAKSNTAAKPDGGSKAQSANTSKPQPQTEKTPVSKSKEASSPSKTTPSSSADNGTRSDKGKNVVNDTPPTSDPIDVDMLSGDDEGADHVQAPKARVKRKLFIEDSEDESPTKKGPALTTSAPKSPVIASRAKKQRVVPQLSDDDEETGEVLSSFTSKLTRFKKGGSQSSRKSSQGSDDDAHLIPSDSSIPTSSHRRSSSGSSASSRRSSAMDSDSDSFIAPDSDVEVDGASRKSTTKVSKAKASRPAPAKHTGSAGGGSYSFLTAAEQREQDKKDQKKDDESPYGFLLDIRDVSAFVKSFLLVILSFMQKDGVRPGDAKYDPRTLFIPKNAWATFTPFEKQLTHASQLYEDDARIGHTEFDLKLTQRVKMSMECYKVGRVDQVETALGAEMRMAADKKKGKPAEKDGGKEKIVRRELNKVYTNGTLVDDELLIDEQAGHCISIREGKTKDEDDDGSAESTNYFGVCVLDSATSEFSLSSFEDDICRTKLETLLRQLRPKEVLYTKGNPTISTIRLLDAILPTSCLRTVIRTSEGFNYEKTLEELKEMYPADEDAEMGDEDAVLSASVPESIRGMATCKDTMRALGSMIWYLRTLNIDKDILSMKNFNIYDPMKQGQGLILDGQTLAHIEVWLVMTGKEGTLLKLLSRCVTPFGKRLFRIWLCMPLSKAADINARLDAVKDIMDHPTFEESFTSIAKGLPDLERIVSRIHARNCKVKDFLKVLTAFKKLTMGMDSLAKSSESFESKTILGLLRSAPDLLPSIKNVREMYQEPESETAELMPVEGKDKVYDDIMSEIQELESELDEELKTFEKKIGCSLTYWHSAQGNKEIYLVQTKPTQKKIPDEWTKSGSTKAAIRWVVPSLQPTIRKLKEARENRSTAIKDFKFRLFAEFDTDRGIWLRAIRVFAELDCLFSLAKSSSALGEPVCRPEFIEGDAAWIDFKDLRHPALATKSDFIPNDVKLGRDVGRIALLTGPNMAGKSTAMRMTAAGIVSMFHKQRSLVNSDIPKIMAQLGMLVPAESVRMCPVDAILTRMGAYDNMFSNASTFKVELDECCKIMRNATPKSFVILDELGRGTSTYVSINSVMLARFADSRFRTAVLHQLATHTLPLSFFATHYGSLTDDFEYHPNIRNMHMSTMVDDEKRELVFLYKLIDGIATSSFGTHVANLAGVPVEVVKRAEVISSDFQKTFKEKIEGKQKKSAAAKLPLVAQADFAYLFKLATGALSMPDDPYKQQELLRGLKETVRKYTITDTTD
ncbi:hypothetical protein HWV62_20944 [Athelia sp. TMB]|nr:hypothetical protein HWV62_20944 [Athelia sp. TMB]